MKRLLIAVMVLVGCAAGQDVSTSVFTTAFMPRTGHELRSDVQTVLLTWTTTEKCYECNTRFLMNCAGDSNDCNVPPKMVVHYGWFTTKAEALKAATDKQWQVSGLFDTTPIPFSRKEIHTKTPQPDREDTAVIYEEKP